MIYQFQGLFFFFLAHTHIAILEYYRKRLIRNSLFWTPLMRKLVGMEHEICLHFVKNLWGKGAWPLAQPASLFFTPVTMSSNTWNGNGGLPFLKKKKNPQICNSWKSSFHLLLNQWHSATNSTLGILVYYKRWGFFVIIYYYYYEKSVPISLSFLLESITQVASPLPPDGLFTRLGTCTLQQDFQGRAKTSEEDDDCFISMIILNNGTSFTLSI